MSNIPTWPLEVIINAYYEEGKLMEPPECFIRQVGTDKVVADMVDPEYANVFGASLDMLAALKMMVQDSAGMGLPFNKTIWASAEAAIAKAEGRQ